MAKRKRTDTQSSLKMTCTFNVHGSFDLQYGFADFEVEQDPEGAEGDLRPTAKALRSLKKEIVETLGAQLCIGEMEVWADCDDQMGNFGD